MVELWMGEDVFRFAQIVIDRMLKPGETGNYVLGFKDESGEFIPRYIGRSDSDLKGEMTGKLATLNYPYFQFSPGNPGFAFQKECAQFHIFGSQLDNKTHPVSPTGSGLKCFLCGL